MIDASEWLATVENNPPASDASILSAEEAIAIRLPADYVELMRKSNGAEGPIGHSGYIALWPVDQLKSLNDAYSVNELAPGLLLFGSDGGETAYAFDLQDSMTVVEVPFIGMNRDSALRVGRSLTDFLTKIATL